MKLLRCLFFGQSDEFLFVGRVAILQTIHCLLQFLFSLEQGFELTVLFVQLLLEIVFQCGLPHSFLSKGVRESVVYATPSLCLYSTYLLNGQLFLLFYLLFHLFVKAFHLSNRKGKNIFIQQKVAKTETNGQRCNNF